MRGQALLAAAAMSLSVLAPVSAMAQSGGSRPNQSVPPPLAGGPGGDDPYYDNQTYPPERYNSYDEDRRGDDNRGRPPPYRSDAPRGYAPPPAYSGSDPCRDEKKGRTAAGVILGGIAGALIGSSVNGHNRDTGAAVGGVTGAIAGGALGNSSTRCGGYYADGPPPAYAAAPPPPAYDPGPPPPPPYAYGYSRPMRGACRWGYEWTRDHWGRPIRERVWMCRGPGGAWQPY